MPQQRPRKVQQKTFDAAIAGAFLCQKREQQGLSQRALAKKAGVSQQTVANIEHGTGSVTLRNLEAVSLALEVGILTVIRRALE
jgi:transcriptional regulator with XRE-family HTH domain